MHETLLDILAEPSTGATGRLFHGELAAKGRSKVPKGPDAHVVLVTAAAGAADANAAPTSMEMPLAGAAGTATAVAASSAETTLEAALDAASGGLAAAALAGTSAAAVLVEAEEEAPPPPPLQPATKMPVISVDNRRVRLGVAWKIWSDMRI